MVYALSGGTDKPTADIKGIPEVVEPSGFDFRKIGLADLSVLTDPNTGPIGEYYKSGFRATAANLPEVARIVDARHLVDLDSDGALTYVSARARDLIERLEPDMHQFEPVVFVDYDRKKLADMFVFFVCQRLDTVDREHTNMILSPHYWRPAKDVFRRKPDLVPPTPTWRQSRKRCSAYPESAALISGAISTSRIRCTYRMRSSRPFTKKV